MRKCSKKNRKKTSRIISGKGKYIETPLQKYRKIFEKRKKIETSDDREFFGTSKNIQSQNLSFNFLFIREELSK